MMNNRKKIKILCLTVAMVMLAGLMLAGCVSSETESFTSLDDLRGGKTFGSVTGYTFDRVTLEYYPDAEIVEFKTFLDEVTGLSSGKIDALLFDAPTCACVCSERSGLKILPEYVAEEDYYFLLPKTDEATELANEFNEWLAEQKESGAIDELTEFWTGAGLPEGRIELDTLTGENGTINIGFCNTSRPDTYYYENEPTGYPVELIIMFCRDRGYGANIVLTGEDSFIQNLKSGKLDIYVGLMSYTEERAESVLYTDSIMHGGICAMVRDEAAGDDTRIFSTIAKSFRKTFITEDRWKMLLSGLGVTALITAAGFALANVVGAGFCAMAMSKRKTLQVIADAFSRIMQGTPMIVILMILYYVVLGKTKVSGITVSIIAFALSTGDSLAQLFYGGITGVDTGQREASLALGFTKWQTFFGVVFPQAARSMLPGYFSTLISLMKGTAIVGYVSVIDITKAGDIVRCSTYEPFFPLISIAAVYFLISFMLLSIMKAIQRKLSPKRVKAHNG